MRSDVTDSLFLLVLFVAMVVVPLFTDVVDEAHALHEEGTLLLRLPAFDLRAHLSLDLKYDHHTQ